MSPAAAAAAEWGAEQSATCQKEKFPNQRSELGKRGQRPVHTPHQHHHGPRHLYQHRASVHMESGVHFSPLRSLIYLLLLHAEVLSHDLHTGLGLQPGLRRVDVLLRGYGLRLLPHSHAPPVVRPGVNSQSDEHKRSHKPSEPVPGVPLHPRIRDVRPGLQLHSRLLGL